jgi:uncharacterized membrane protein
VERRARRRRTGYDGHGEKLARALGWFSVGLGLAEVAAPRRLARAIGIHDHAHTLRLFGLREIGTGLGIFSRPRPAAWLWGRVAGDLIDLFFLGAAGRARRAEPKRIAAATAAVLGVTALDVFCGERLSGARTAVSRSVAPDGSIRVTKSIAINRPREECYRFWRELQNLPRFLRHLESVTVKGDRRSHWKAKAPAGSEIEWDAEITDERPNEMLAWRSLDGSQVDNSGSVHFEPAPKSQGTVVRVALRYRPPAGALGAAVARLFGEEPEQQIGDDLRRLKQVLETGEVITTEGQPHGPVRASIVRARSKA